jgi:hypothetical protein
MGITTYVPAASHPFITKHARAGRDAQNGLGGVTGFKPGSQSDLLLLVGLHKYKIILTFPGFVGEI